MNKIHEQAADLLMIVWRGIPANYKSKYRRTIWRQFEDQVRSAAYTSSLAKFVSSLCSKLQADVGKRSEEREEAERILNSGNDRELLKVMRDETTLVVLMVRVANQERREEWDARQKEKRAEQDAMEDPLFGLPEEEIGK